MAQKFNRHLFERVVRVNLDNFINSVTAKAEEKGIRIGSLIVEDENEMREMARDFFTKCLAEELNSRL